MTLSSAALQATMVTDSYLRYCIQALVLPSFCRCCRGVATFGSNEQLARAANRNANTRSVPRLSTNRQQKRELCT